MKNQSRRFIKNAGGLSLFFVFTSLIGFSQENDQHKFSEIGLSINVNLREFNEFNDGLSALNQPTFNSLSSEVMFRTFRGIGKGWLFESGVSIGDSRRRRTPEVENTLNYTRIFFGVGKLININSTNRLYPMISPTFGLANFRSRERVDQNFNQLAQPGNPRPITEMGMNVVGMDITINYDWIKYNGEGTGYEKTGLAIGYHLPIFYIQRNGINGLPTMNPGGVFLSYKDSIFRSRFNK